MVGGIHMKRKAKKILAVFMAALMILPLALPASAAWGLSGSKDVPIIHIYGDGESIHDADGNKLLKYKDLLGNINGDGDGEEDENRKEEIYKSVANVVMPFLIQGLGTGDYQPYYDALQKEIGELFGDLLLDNNGEASNGSQMNPECAAIMAKKRHEDTAKGKGYYGLNDYVFWYDWRLDPLTVADSLHEYIEDIKAATNKKEVAIVGRCLGSSVATAYVAKYGMDGIRGIGFDGGVVNGAEVLSETISGKFRFDGNAINRFLMDCNALGMFKVDEFINETIDMLAKAGVFDTIAGVTKEVIYYQVVEGVTSALALSTFFTFPSYWAAVKSDDYEEAKRYVFGEEGSAKREEYAGLIAKLDNYDKVVRQQIPNIMNEINDNGNLAVIAKYGVQIAPVIASNNAVADQFASVACASYGATTSDIYSTLSDEYIAQRVAEGKGKYISPDRQIDASTCQFPDQTWFLKGAKHSHWTDVENRILYNVITADHQLTVDDCEYSQFVVYDVKTSGATAMTEENCDTYYWKADKNADNPPSSASRLFSFLLSLLNWLLSLINKISHK